MKNRIVHVSIDMTKNSHLDFESIEEQIYKLVSETLKAEIVVTSEDEDYEKDLLHKEEEEKAVPLGEDDLDDTVFAEWDKVIKADWSLNY